jgi:hypothetical protein
MTFSTDVKGVHRRRSMYLRHRTSVLLMVLLLSAGCGGKGQENGSDSPTFPDYSQTSSNGQPQPPPLTTAGIDVLPREVTAPSWKPAGLLPKGLYDHGAAVWNGTLYVSGGFGPGPRVNTREIYSAPILSDHTLGPWRTGTLPPKNLVLEGGVQASVVGIDGHAMAAAMGRLYVVGGKFQYVRTDCYPVASASCFQPTPTAWNRTLLHGAIQPDGSLTDWQEVPLPDVVGPYTPGVTVADGYLYVIGGWDGTRNTEGVIFAQICPDGGLGEWQTAPDLPIGLSKHALTAAGGFLYVVGGNTGEASASRYSQGYQDTVYYSAIQEDHSPGPWRTGRPLPNTFIDHKVAVLGDRLLVIGGRNVNEYYYNLLGEYYDYTLFESVLSAVIQPDGSLAPWTILNDLPGPRIRHAVAAADNAVFLVGGSSGQDIDQITCISGMCSAPYRREAGVFVLNGTP